MTPVPRIPNRRTDSGPKCPAYGTPPTQTTLTTRRGDAFHRRTQIAAFAFQFTRSQGTGGPAWSGTDGPASAATMDYAAGRRRDSPVGTQTWIYSLAGAPSSGLRSAGRQTDCAMKPNTRRRRQRDPTVELSRVGGVNAPVGSRDS